MKCIPEQAKEIHVDECTIYVYLEFQNDLWIPIDYYMTSVR